MDFFFSFWKDSDLSYRVDERGWGWLLLAMLLLTPFVIVAFTLKNVATVITVHPFISTLVYLIVLIGISLFSYRKEENRNIWLEMLATMISFFPFFLLEGFIEIPAIMSYDDEIQTMVSMVLEWGFLTFLVLGIAILIQTIAPLLGVKKHFIIGMLYSVLFGFIIKAQITQEKWSIIKDLYLSK